jgi:NitT/TauT family transport system substrate-binding protein
MFSFNRWNRRQALRLLTGFSGSLMLNACTQSTSTRSNPSTTPINSTTSSGPLSLSLGIAVGWVGYAPLYIAIKKNFFKELGLDFSLVTFGSNSEIRAAFTAGKVNGAAVVTSEAVLATQADENFKIVLVADNSLGADGILARKRITSIQDFRGQTIVVELGGVSHFFLLQVLKEANLTSNDVKLINATPEAAAAAYGAGKADIAVTYEPFLSQANAAQLDGRMIYDSSKMPTAITDIYIFNSQFLAAHAKAVEIFVQGVFKGLDFLKTNSSEALAIASKELSVTPKELQTQLQGVRLVNSSLNKEMLSNPDSNLYLLNSLKELETFLQDQGQIKTSPDMSKYLDPSFVNALS